MTKREQLARAAHKADRVKMAQWDYLSDGDRWAYFAMVDAILAELREPDERSGLARCLAKYDWSVESPDFDVWFEGVRKEYESRICDVIDAIE